MLMNSLFRQIRKLHRLILLGKRDFVFFSTLSLSLASRGKVTAKCFPRSNNKTQVNTKQDGFKAAYIAQPLVIYPQFLIPGSGRPAAIKLPNYMFYQEQPLSPEYWITEIKYE